MADDTLFPVMDLNPKWNDQVEPVGRFNCPVADSPRLSSPMLPIRDGMIVVTINQPKNRPSSF